MNPTRQRLASALSLIDKYKNCSHGGPYWKDDYLLDRWDQQIQPVVHRNETYRGYKLLRRVGSWCWLTKDPCTGEFLTVKFLSRGHDSNELKMTKYIRDHCKSPFVSMMRHHFSIPHHLSHTSLPRFKDLSFQAIVYPMMGTCMGRIHSRLESHGDNPAVPLTLERRQRYISQIIKGLSHLHSIGVVHADLHPGNIILAPPSNEHMAKFLATTPLEIDVRLKDGSLPPAWMPRRVSEPENTGFDPSGIKIIDFGYSFRPKKGVCYTADQFPEGFRPAPELLSGKKQTVHPFKVDSWFLGILIYFVLSGELCFACGTLEEYRLALDELRTGKDYTSDILPADVRRRYMPVILALLERDPEKRLAVEDLIKGPYSEITNVE